MISNEFFTSQKTKYNSKQIPVRQSLYFGIKLPPSRHVTADIQKLFVW